MRRKIRVLFFLCMLSSSVIFSQREFTVNDSINSLPLLLHRLRDTISKEDVKTKNPIALGAKRFKQLKKEISKLTIMAKRDIKKSGIPSFLCTYQWASGSSKQCPCLSLNEVYLLVGQSDQFKKIEYKTRPSSGQPNGILDVEKVNINGREYNVFLLRRGNEYDYDDIIGFTLHYRNLKGIDFTIELGVFTNPDPTKPMFNMLEIFGTL